MIQGFYDHSLFKGVMQLFPEAVHNNSALGALAVGECADHRQCGKTFTVDRAVAFSPMSPFFPSSIHQLTLRTLSWMLVGANLPPI